MAIITAETISNAGFAYINRIPGSWQRLIGASSPGTTVLNALSALVHDMTSAAGCTGNSQAADAISAALSNAEGAVNAADAALLAKNSLAASVIENYADLVPTFKGITAMDLKFSTVLSDGQADLTNPNSPVHMRFYHIQEVAPRFYNFNPGKLTFAQIAANQLRSMLGVTSSNPSDALDTVIKDLIQATTSDMERISS